MDLLNTNTVLAQTKAYCALHIIVVGEGKFPGFPLEVVDKLYKTAFSGLFTLLKHYPLDDVKNLFNSFKLLLTGIRETGNLSRELKKHSQLMEKFSLQFLEALIASALDEKRTGIQSFQILTFVCLSTWDFQQLQTVSPLSEKYSAVVGTLIFQMTQKVSWMQNCASEDILKLTDSLINIIIKELKSQKQPNEPFLLLVKNWFFAFKTITDGNTVKIANEHATRFNKQISEHYTEEIYNKYVVVYT